MHDTPAATCTDTCRSHTPASALSDSSAANTGAAARWGGATTQLARKWPDATHVAVATAGTSPASVCFVRCLPCSCMMQPLSG